MICYPKVYFHCLCMLFFNILIFTWDNANKSDYYLTKYLPVFREIIFKCQLVGSQCDCVLAVTAVTTLISRLESVNLSDCRKSLFSSSLMHACLLRSYTTWKEAVLKKKRLLYKWGRYLRHCPFFTELCSVC